MTAVRVPEIAQSLLERAAATREYRASLLLLQLSAAEVDSGREAERENAEYLRHVSTAHGWPGRSLVGEEAAEAAFTIALHAGHDPAVQGTLLRMLGEAARRGEAQLVQWAHVYDGVLVQSHRPQFYGTQYRVGPTGVVPVRIAEPAHLDRRRASVGLPTYAEQTEALLRRFMDPSAAATTSPPGFGRTSGAGRRTARYGEGLRSGT
ncbi:DUF6624 domain-containing protein [Streptomyces sp. Z26]|uniref:DUF6624 domain-containing protein n=1 Tax=Streptomyces sp. Z26 TaxID=2500177 RepID=UPI000EF16671|nr:DUF6624 domain-containing protein [Streptomyces sp. Z26]RLL67399.1 hypothetical protein D7M15_11620 [Streptomyces sp. Z26]